MKTENTDMSEKKIAVVFPGMGYHADKPLLYYSKRIARTAGYEIVELKYEFPYKAREIMNDKARMKEAFEIAVSQIKEQVKEISFEEYKDILFIGKSIGTAIAAYFDGELNVGARHIIFTPVPQTFDRLKKNAGIVFHGTADPWCATDVAESKCGEFELDLYKVENANHSLETESPLIDIKNIQDVMDKVNEYIMK